MAVALRGSLVAFPTGNPTTGGTGTIPSQVVAGDWLEVVFTSRDHTAGTAMPTVTDNDTGGNTWTVTALSSDRKHLRAVKRATSGTASKTVTIGGCVGSMSAVMAAWSGTWQAGDPTTNLTTETNAAADETHAGITPTNADSMIRAFITNYANDNAVTNPSWATLGAATGSAEKLSTGGSDCGTHTAYRAQSGGPAATGNFTWTQTDGTTYSSLWALRQEPPTVSVSPDPVTIPLVVVAPVVTAGRVVSPTPVTIPLVIPDPTVTADSGGVTVTPSPVAISLVVPVPAVSAGRIVAPDPVPILVQVPTPVVSAGRVVTPDPTPVVLVIPTPAVTAGRLVSPAPVTVILTLPDPEVSTGGAVLVTPAPVPIQLTIPVHTAIAGRIVSPDPVAAQLVIPAPIIMAGRLVAPAPVEIALAVPVPAVIAGRLVTPDPVVALLIIPVPEVTSEIPYAYVLPLTAAMVDAMGVTGAMVELPRSSGTMTTLAVIAEMEEIP